MQSKIDFGKALKKNRKRFGMTQTQLAETAGISVQRTIIIPNVTVSG